MTARSKRQPGASLAGDALGGGRLPSVSVKKKKRKKTSRGK